MDAVKYQTISRWLGVNNVDSSLRLKPIQINDREFVYPLQQANNVEIDNSYMMKSRTGYSSALSGTDIHSLWSDNSTCFFIDSNSLYKLDSSYNTILIRAGLQSKAKMSFVKVNDRFYYTNGFQIGYINKDTDHNLVNPNREFKEPLPAGEHIEFFKGCLYVSRNNILYISDPLCDYYDTRYGYKIFSNYINMVRGVDDGMYISSDKTYFMNGSTNEDFILEDAYPFKAIEYTDVSVNGSFLDESISNDIIIFTAENGICVGNKSGKVLNMTETRYALSSYGQGSCLIRDINNIRHYINVLF